MVKVHQQFLPKVQFVGRKGAEKREGTETAVHWGKHLRKKYSDAGKYKYPNPHETLIKFHNFVFS